MVAPHLGPDERADVVEILLPARPDLIPTIRTVASDLAARAEFDQDSISDLRMAVDEATVAVLHSSAPDGVLRCVFVLGPDWIEVTVSCRPSASPAALDTGGFGWRILESLTDEVQVLGDADTTGIRLMKKRPPG